MRGLPVVISEDIAPGVMEIRDPDGRVLAWAHVDPDISAVSRGSVESVVRAAYEMLEESFEDVVIKINVKPNLKIEEIKMDFKLEEAAGAEDKRLYMLPNGRVVDYNPLRYQLLVAGIGLAIAIVVIALIVALT